MVPACRLGRRRTHRTLRSTDAANGALIRDGFDVARAAGRLPKPLRNRDIDWSRCCADGERAPSRFDERSFETTCPRGDEPEQDGGLWIGQPHARLP